MKAGTVNLPIFIMSFLLSIVLWVFVYLQNAPRPMPQVYPLKLVAQGLDEKSYIVTDIPTTVDAIAQGTTERLKHLTDSNPVAVVDLGNAQPGKKRYPALIFPESVRDMFGDTPPMVTVEIARFARREMPVVLTTSGELSDKTLMLDQTTIDPKTVTVQGPEPDVRRVAEVRAVLDLTQVHPSQASYLVGIEPLASGNRPLPRVTLDHAFVRITTVLSPAAEDKSVFVSPVFVGSPAAGYAVGGYMPDPEQVTLIGKSLDLAQISKVLTDPIRIDGVREDTTFDATLRLPPGIKARPSTVKVRVTVHPQTLPKSPDSSAKPSAPANSGSPSQIQ